MKGARIGVLRSLLFVAAIFGLGFFCQVLRQRWSADEADVVFEPSVIEVAEPVSEGEEVEVDLTLVNGTNSTVMLEFASGSCGCLNLSTEDGVVLQGPRRLEVFGVRP